MQTIKEFNVLQFNTNNSIPSFIYTQLNGSKYCYWITNDSVDAHKEFQVLQFNTNNSIQHHLLYTVKWLQVWLFSTNNSIKHQSLVYTQLNDQTVLFLTINFSISHLFKLKRGKSS